MDVEQGIKRLERSIAAYGATRAFVAFSGGVDSAVVLALAARALGTDAVSAVTAVSPSYPMGELEQARKVAESLGVIHQTIATREVEREAYARNDAMRCYHCKTELYASLAGVAALSSSADVVVLAGANVDDLADFRPGLRAAERRGVRNPLLEEGMGKALVRALAARLGLAVAEKPALACLSSRVAYGIRITPELLARVDRAEQAVRRLGFDQVRVRHLGDEASIEVSPGEVKRLAASPDLPDLLHRLRDLGWANVRIDPDGYRMGSLNASLPTP